MEEVVEDGAFKESRLRQCQKPAYLQDAAVKNRDLAPGAGCCPAVMGSADGLWTPADLLRWTPRGQEMHYHATATPHGSWPPLCLQKRVFFFFLIPECKIALFRESADQEVVVVRDHARGKHFVP